MADWKLDTVWKDESIIYCNKCGKLIGITNDQGEVFDWNDFKPMKYITCKDCVPTNTPLCRLNDEYI